MREISSIPRGKKLGAATVSLIHILIVVMMVIAQVRHELLGGVNFDRNVSGLL